MLEHKHLIVRAEVASPPTDVEYMKDWLRKLVVELNMNILMGPYAVYSDMVGNRGLTAVCVIETSHIALHAWDEEFPFMLQLDVYSCSDVQPGIVLDMLEVFDPIHVDYKFLDRKNKFIEML